MARTLQYIKGETESERPFIKGLTMENKRVIDKRYIRLEEVMKAGFIPFLGGRPERVSIIKADKILNLRILLNTTSSVEMFIAEL